MGEVIDESPGAVKAVTLDFLDRRPAAPLYTFARPPGRAGSSASERDDLDGCGGVSPWTRAGRAGTRSRAAASAQRGRAGGYQ